MSQWDPGQYERFVTERGAPFFDLLRLIEATGTRPAWWTWAAEQER